MAFSSRLTKIAFLAALALFPIRESGGAECVNPNFKPFAKGESIVCPIKWRRFNETESAIFTPLDENTWIGWIHPTVFFMEAVELKVDKNDCEGIRLIGRLEETDFRVFIDATSQKINATWIDDKYDGPNYGTGGCKTLDEDDFAIEVRKSESD